MRTTIMDRREHIWWSSWVDADTSDDVLLHILEPLCPLVFKNIVGFKITFIYVGK